MTPGKKLLITAAVAITAGALIIALWALSSPRESLAQREARRLYDELSPGQMRYFLIDCGMAIRADHYREMAIVQELAALGPPSVPYLIRALDHASGSVQVLAAQGLGRLGPEAEAAAPKLLENIKYGYAHVRPAATEALVRIGRGDEGLAVLTKMLRSSNEFDRSAAARVLGNLGPLAEPAIPELIRALEDVERVVRDKASRALVRIGPPAVPALGKAVDHPDAIVREHATWALAQIRPGAAAATSARHRVYVRAAAATPSHHRVYVRAIVATTAYHRVYVIDRSGSMVDRLPRVKIEVLAAIGQLKEFQDFHVVFYGMSSAGGPAKRLLPATEQNKLKAVDFVKRFRARGRSDPVPALKHAFGVLGQAGLKPMGKVIHLITDGVFPDSKKVLEVIRRLNAGRDVHIHTILVGERNLVAVKVMKTIARENGGKYVYIRQEEL